MLIAGVIVATKLSVIVPNATCPCVTYATKYFMEEGHSNCTKENIHLTKREYPEKLVAINTQASR